MFSNRFVVVVDACSLVSVLRRNTILSLANSGLFRVRWSSKILDETETALAKIFEERSVPEYRAMAKKQRNAMESAFEEATVENYQDYCPSVVNWPDPDDAHVVAAAIACDASLIVTENLKDFPPNLLVSFGIEAKSADHFIADIVDLYPPKAIQAIAAMRQGLKKPSIDPRQLILHYEKNEMLETASILVPYESQL